MFGIDDWIGHFSDGTTTLLVALVAIFLGLRHASDPDHVAAVTTLIASGRERAGRAAARLGLAWGVGHATSLFAFGAPIVLFEAYLPAAVQRAAETAVGVVIAALALSLLVRWRRGAFHPHLHPPGATRAARTLTQAYGIGLIHGLGGTAGVGVLLLASIHNRGLALLALALFASFTAFSMSAISGLFGLALGSRPLRSSFATLAPVAATCSLAFGIWYALGALEVTPYFF